MIRGDVAAYSRKAKVALTPMPKFQEPTLTHMTAAHVANASYIKLNESHDAAADYLEQFGALIDDELSTKNGLVVLDRSGEVIVGFRGAQRQPENPNEGEASRLDRENINRVLSGKKPLYDVEQRLMQNALERYGRVDSVYAYSLGANKIMNMARDGLLDSADNITVLNPLIGPRDVAKGVPKEVTIARTVEDFASGPGLSLALQRGTVSPDQIETVRGIKGLNEHDLGHFVPQGERGLTPVEEAAARGELTAKAVANHRAVASGLINAGAFVASDALVEAIAPKQPRIAKEVETGTLGATMAATARSLAFAGVLPAASAVLAEIPGAIAGVVAAGETYNALRPALDKLDPKDDLLQDDAKDLVADFATGAAAGAATAVATDTIVAGAGVAGALLTGTEIGASLGVVGGPAGVALGALGGATAGAVVGMGAWLVGKLL